MENDEIIKKKDEQIDQLIKLCYGTNELCIKAQENNRMHAENNAKVLKRALLCIVAIVVVCTTVSWGCFVWYESQYDYVTVDSSGGDANYIGRDGDINGNR
ncbi:MAG TPA: hypothetical protein VHO72_10680 [Bacteroidales bacterium]|nr:hypothetical protein [Bacteroidales bacterium]